MTRETVEPPERARAERRRDRVSAARKRRVPTDFDGLGARYDLLQRLNPGYRKHLRWSAQRMGLPDEANILDLCCGTGLSTEALARVYPRASITGLDASAEMLAAARQKPSLRGARFLLGDAADPAAHGAKGPFDGVLIAYGLRNLPDPDACLERLARLLRPGGALAVHEYAVSDRLLARLVWNAMAAGVIAPLGAAIGRSPALFRYLRRSVLDFDGVPELEARLRRAGFADVKTLPMDGWQRGIAHTVVGRRPA